MLSGRCKNALQFDRVNEAQIKFWENIQRWFVAHFFHSSVGVSFVACWLHFLHRYYPFCKAITIKLATRYHTHFNMSREFRIKSQFFLQSFIRINFHNPFSWDCRSLSGRFRLIWNGTVETLLNNRCSIRFGASMDFSSRVLFIYAYFWIETYIFKICSFFLAISTKQTRTLP